MDHSDRPEVLRILGVPITHFQSNEHAVDCIVERVKTGRRTFCVAINPKKIWCACVDPKLMSILQAADLHVCDGVGAALAVRLIHGISMNRVTGVELFLRLLEKAESDRLGIYLLGASESSNEGACRKLRERHPHLRIVGRRNGYFKDDLDVLREIGESRPDMLFVAMGSPKQELWIARHRHRICAPFVMGVGGAFDVMSGEAQWAPQVFRRTGMEFLYRSWRQPSRFKEIAIPVNFVRAVLKETIRLRCSGKRYSRPQSE